MSTEVLTLYTAKVSSRFPFNDLSGH
jgi:hypothetical protein